MPTPVKVGAIQGYALVAVAASMRTASIQGYALVRTPNLPNFTIAPQAALLAAMNKQYARSFTLSQVSFGPPVALVGDQDYNTTTLLTPNRTSGYSGTKTMRYNRVDLALAISGKDPALPTTGMGSTLWASLAAINTKYALALTTADVVDRSISGQSGITITASDTSVLFIPGTTMRIGSQIPTMSAAFPQVELFAF